ncbi:MAG: hypothetical protein HYR94_25305 [Chloroflexi bacterium]|nr:hypothetical protein [Chloroflexota bacterium]
MGRSLMERIKGKLGYRHVPDNMVQVIFRDGRYHRAEGNTFIRRRVHDESYGPQIRVGIRVVENLYQNIASRDGILHNINVHVKVFFDLRQADALVAPILVEHCETIIQGKVKGLVDLALRREIAQLDSTRLLQPDVAVKLEEAIRKRLERNLGFFGVSLPTFEDALIVKEILPPERMQDTRVEATNISETIDSFNHLSHEEIRQAVFAHLYRDMGAKPLQVRAMNVPDTLRPDAAAESEKKFPVLRQPTGRVYDN